MKLATRRHRRRFDSDDGYTVVNKIVPAERRQDGPPQARDKVVGVGRSIDDRVTVVVCSKRRRLPSELQLHVYQAAYTIMFFLERGFTGDMYAVADRKGCGQRVRNISKQLGVVDLMHPLGQAVVPFGELLLGSATAAWRLGFSAAGFLRS